MDKEDIGIKRRHTGSHIMTFAVKMTFPDVDLKLGVGPWTDTEFYQDFDFGDHKISDADFKKIEKKMRWIINKDFKTDRKTFSEKEAREIWKGDPYKIELIDGIVAKGEEISAYDFIDSSGRVVYRDICAGPHLESTGKLGVFKLTRLAGAYWRGKETNPMLTRIYGVAFENQESLGAYEQLLIEAEKRDHRRLGKELDLFSFHEEAPGAPFWHPKGMILMNKLIEFWQEEHKKFGYQEIKTPLILHEKLWHMSGHYDHYKENMYFTEIDEQSYAVKPMNCPGGILVYKNSLRSYREFPIRMGELGLVHRYEKSGVLHGLFRVRVFTQDDAHIYCREDQVEQEIAKVIELAQILYDRFGFEYEIELSTRPEKRVGDDKMWDFSENILEKVMKKTKLPYKINEGDGAFYGPKLDFHIKDAIGRTWQCGTIQLDFSMPERFDLEYVGEDGQKHCPIMIHRALYGSLERFIGILIEHTAGHLPVWCAPVQAHILPVAKEHEKYATELLSQIEKIGGRAELQDAGETLGKRIRNSQTHKIPFSVIVGDEEVKNKTVTVRKYGEEKDEKMEVEEFLKKITR